MHGMGRDMETLPHNETKREEISAHANIKEMYY